uniref:Uncharacterized protein n=1 Tax=Anguilla anguilla TaxID=7936 RepID=A0A0E9X561_ANGAN
MRSSACFSSLIHYFWWCEFCFCFMCVFVCVLLPSQHKGKRYQFLSSSSRCLLIGQQPVFFLSQVYHSISSKPTLPRHRGGFIPCAVCERGNELCESPSVFSKRRRPQACLHGTAQRDFLGKLHISLCDVPISQTGSCLVIDYCIHFPWTF